MLWLTLQCGLWSIFQQKGTFCTSNRGRRWYILVQRSHWHFCGMEPKDYKTLSECWPENKRPLDLLCVHGGIFNQLSLVPAHISVKLCNEVRVAHTRSNEQNYQRYHTRVCFKCKCSQLKVEIWFCSLKLKKTTPECQFHSCFNTFGAQETSISLKRGRPHQILIWLCLKLTDK